MLLILYQRPFRMAIGSTGSDHHQIVFQEWDSDSEPDPMDEKP